MCSIHLCLECREQGGVPYSGDPLLQIVGADMRPAFVPAVKWYRASLLLRSAGFVLVGSVADVPSKKATCYTSTAGMHLHKIFDYASLKA